MLMGVASLPLSFSPSGTQAFYIINRPNCLNICNTVYIRCSKEKMKQTTYLKVSYSALPYTTGSFKPSYSSILLSTNYTSQLSLMSLGKLGFQFLKRTKAQIISKCLFGIFNSPKIRTKTIRPEVPQCQSRIFLFVFGRIEDTKKTFRN